MTFAQTRTGSGGIIEEKTESVLPPKEDAGSGVKSGSLEEKLIFAIKEFEFQDIKCRSEGHRYLDLKQSDFMQLYLKLSVLKSTFVADNKCQNVTAYFQCLYSPKLKKELEILTKNKEMRKYIQTKYKLEKKEVREVIRFFKNLDKSCENNGCKM